MSTICHHHPGVECVLQFAPIALRLPGQFVAMQPYQPNEITITQHDGHCIVAGRYGFELFSGNEFVVTVDGQPRSFTRFEDIPQHIGAVLRFQPGTVEHEIDFTVRTTEAEHTHRVHCEPSGWVQRLQALVAREKGAACPQ